MKKKILQFLLRCYLKANIRQGSAQHRADFHELIDETLKAMESAFHEESRIQLKGYLKQCVDEVDCSYP